MQAFYLLVSLLHKIKGLQLEGVLFFIDLKAELIK